MQGLHSPERLACRRALQLPIDCEVPLADPSNLQQRSDNRESADPATAGRQPVDESSSMPQLAAELAAATGFLRGLNARLAEQGTSSG